MKDFGVYDEAITSRDIVRCLADAIPTMWVNCPWGKEVR